MIRQNNSTVAKLTVLLFMNPENLQQRIAPVHWTRVAFRFISFNCNINGVQVVNENLRVSLTRWESTKKWGQFEFLRSDVAVCSGLLHLRANSFILRVAGLASQSAVLAVHCYWQQHAMTSLMSDLKPSWSRMCDVGEMLRNERFIRGEVNA